MHLDEIPDDGSRQHEVFARFGLAAYMAQVFEAALMNLIVVAYLATGRFNSDDAFERLVNRLQQLTAGQRLTQVRNLGFVSENLAARAADCVRLRNRLAHHFFWDHSLRFMTNPGMQEMLEELDTARDQFESIASKIRQLVVKIGTPVGVSNDRIEAVTDELMKATKD